MFEEYFIRNASGIDYYKVHSFYFCNVTLTCCILYNKNIGSVLKTIYTSDIICNSNQE